MKAGEVDAYLARREAKVANLREGVASRVIWAKKPGAASEVVVVYVHGFSATSEELRPVPDTLAKALRANLFFARLSGHGQDGAALGAARLEDWLADMDEVMEIARALGQKVVLVSCSTGGTLATIKSAEEGFRDRLEGLIFVSPNYGLGHPAARILSWPFVRHWGPVLAGRERRFEVTSPEHAAFWTTRYPTRAVFTMMDAVRAALKTDVSQIRIPALFLYSEGDRVVAPKVTARVAQAWGGPATVRIQHPGAKDDPMQHLIAGEIMSPSMSDKIGGEMIAWAQALLGQPAPQK